MNSFPSINIIPKNSKTKRNADDLSDYISDIKNDFDKIPRDELGQLMSGGSGFICEDREGQLIEMKAHLANCLDAKARPLQHLVFSYKNYVPSHDQVKRHIQTYLQIVGMTDHMYFYDCHANTENFHVHVALNRLSPLPEANGRYYIAGNGLVTSKEEKKAGVRIRVNEAGCRQAAMSRICRDEGWEPPPNVTHDADGKKIPRLKKGSKKASGTRAGENKSGIESRESQIAALAWEIFTSAQSRGMLFAELEKHGLEIALAKKNGRIAGGKIISSDGVECGFARMNEEKGLFKKFNAKFDLFGTVGSLSPVCIEEPFGTETQRRKALKALFLNIVDKKEGWDYFIAELARRNKRLIRTGGGLVIEDESGQIKLSDVANKYSMSKLELLFGSPCPIKKQASPEDLLVTEARSIIAVLVSRGRGTRDIQYELSKINAVLEVVPITLNDGRHREYTRIRRGNVSITLFELGRNDQGRILFTMHHLEQLDKVRWRDTDDYIARLKTWRSHASPGGLTTPDWQPPEHIRGKLQKDYPELIRQAPLFHAIKDFFCKKTEDLAEWLAVQRFSAATRGPGSNLPADLSKSVRELDEIINPGLRAPKRYPGILTIAAAGVGMPVEEFAQTKLGESILNANEEMDYERMGQKHQIDVDDDSHWLLRSLQGQYRPRPQIGKPPACAKGDFKQ